MADQLRHFHKCNGFLRALSVLNAGVNYGPSFEVMELPAAPTLTASLDQYFSAQCTSISPPQPAAAWHIRATPFPADWTAAVLEIAHRWFFLSEFSPTTKLVELPRGVSDEFMLLLKCLVGSAPAYRVEVTPPLWYEIIWDDIAFECDGPRYLLHFGFSD